MKEKPSDEIFQEIITASERIWRERYSDEFGYVSEKVERLYSLENEDYDSVLIAYRMFDPWNKLLLISLLSEDAVKYIKEND
jgi:hypothetical protein